jgi:hypothetical protein
MNPVNDLTNNAFIFDDKIINILNEDFDEKYDDYDESAGYHRTYQIPEYYEIVSEQIPLNYDKNIYINFEITLSIKTEQHDGCCSAFEEGTEILSLDKNGKKLINIIAENNEQLLEKCKQLQYVSTCYNSSSLLSSGGSGYCTLLCWCKVLKITKT